MKYNDNQPAVPVTTYRELTVGKTLYRVTSVYKGEIDLKNALEDLTVRRVTRDSLSHSEKTGVLP